MRMLYRFQLTQKSQQKSNIFPQSQINNFYNYPVTKKINFYDESFNVNNYNDDCKKISENFEDSLFLNKTNSLFDQKHSFDIFNDKTGFIANKLNLSLYNENNINKAKSVNFLNRKTSKENRTDSQFEGMAMKKVKNNFEEYNTLINSPISINSNNSNNNINEFIFNIPNYNNDINKNGGDNFDLGKKKLNSRNFFNNSINTNYKINIPRVRNDCNDITNNFDAKFINQYLSLENLKKENDVLLKILVEDLLTNRE